MSIDYDSYAKQFGRTDYWRQVKRTVNGIPVSDDDIQLIVKRLYDALDLKKDDYLLDLACGNGALSQFLFDSIYKFHGVDQSSYLIDIAKSDFEEKNLFTFCCSDVMDYISSEIEPEKYTKVLCYGSFSYFFNAGEILSLLNSKFKNVEVVFIGNLPDLDKVKLFYKDSIPNVQLLKSHDTSIGVWRNMSEFRGLANDSGWEVEFIKMPENFYSSHYRYDAILRRI